MVFLYWMKSIKCHHMTILFPHTQREKKKGTRTTNVCPFIHWWTFSRCEMRRESSINRKWFDRFFLKGWCVCFFYIHLSSSFQCRHYFRYETQKRKLGHQRTHRINESKYKIYGLNFVWHTVNGRGTMKITFTINS